MNRNGTVKGRESSGKPTLTGAPLTATAHTFPAPVLAEPSKKPEDQSAGQVTAAIESALSCGEVRESTIMPSVGVDITDSRGGE